MKTRIIRALIAITAILFIVQILYVLNIRLSYLPSPLQIMGSFFSLLFSGQIFKDLSFTLIRVLVGYVLAALVAIPLGLYLAWNTKLSDYVRPIIEVLRPIPPIAWVPIAILLFGLGNLPAYFIVFIGSFFPIFTNTYFGAKSIPNVITRTCQSYGVKGFNYFYKILFFYTLPNIFNGLKVGLGMAWMSVIAAELVGVQGGLGYFIEYNRLLLRTDYVIAGMLYIGILGLLSAFALTFIERACVPWRKQKQPR